MGKKSMNRLQASVPNSSALFDSSTQIKSIEGRFEGLQILTIKDCPLFLHLSLARFPPKGSDIFLGRS